MNQLKKNTAKTYTMKTIRKWFDELEEPYRSQALKNTRTDILNCETESLRSSLMEGFTWIDSPQGYKYWQDLHGSLINKENTKKNTKNE